MTTEIVILNWNGEKFLERYLPPLLKSIEGLDGVRVTVADNASEDSSRELVAKSFPSVKYIQLKKNYGFAEGYNRALKKMDADYLLLLNSDVEVADGWLHPLLEWMELHPECGICGPKLHQTGNRDMFEYAGAAGGYIDKYGFPFCRGRVMKMVEKDDGQYDIPEEVMWASGAAFMIRRELFNSLGGFCKDFFAHMEEIDLCWRARLEGWKVNVVPRSTVYHLGGGSLPQDSPYKLFLNYRNNLSMLSRCLPQTIALDYAFNLIGEIADPDEGPDFFGCCCDEYNRCDDELKLSLAETAAILGLKKADAVIRRRMLIDDLAAVAYLLRGQFRNFLAVVRAHKEFRSVRHKTTQKQLRGYIQQVVTGKRLEIARNLLTDEPLDGNWLSASFGLKCIWSKWVVLQAVLKKDTIFAYVNKTLK